MHLQDDVLFVLNQAGIESAQACGSNIRKHRK